MCGRFASQLPPDAIARLFRTAGDVPNLGPNWNVAPTQAAMVVRRHLETGERRLDALRWGLVPHFAKDLKKCTRPPRAPPYQGINRLPRQNSPQSMQGNGAR
jgi:putative SOS response-associated peptidase YedK